MNSLEGVREEWRERLRRQGRSLKWLAERTGAKYQTVRLYSARIRREPDDWLARVAEVIGNGD